MKFEKVPAENFVVKIELDYEEADDLLKDLDMAEESQNFEPGTEEFYKQLKALF